GRFPRQPARSATSASACASLTHTTGDPPDPGTAVARESVACGHGAARGVRRRAGAIRIREGSRISWNTLTPPSGTLSLRARGFHEIPLPLGEVGRRTFGDRVRAFPLRGIPGFFHKFYSHAVRVSRLARVRPEFCKFNKIAIIQQLAQRGLVSHLQN